MTLAPGGSSGRWNQTLDGSTIVKCCTTVLPLLVYHLRAFNEQCKTGVAYISKFILKILCVFTKFSQQSLGQGKSMYPLSANANVLSATPCLLVPH